MRADRTPSGAVPRPEHDTSRRLAGVIVGLAAAALFTGSAPAVAGVMDPGGSEAGGGVADGGSSTTLRSLAGDTEGDLASSPAPWATEPQGPPECDGVGTRGPDTTGAGSGGEGSAMESEETGSGEPMVPVPSITILTRMPPPPLPWWRRNPPRTRRPGPRTAGNRSSRTPRTSPWASPSPGNGARKVRPRGPPPRAPPGTAAEIMGFGADHALTVKGDPPTLFGRLRKPSWEDVVATRQAERSYGRKITRAIKVVDVPGWARFPGTAQLARPRRGTGRRPSRSYT